MPEADALQALDPVEFAQRAGVLRADPVDQDFVELADLAPALMTGKVSTSQNGNPR